MVIKRVVDTSFWIDTEDYTPEERYFFAWLLTNPFTTQLGIYKIALKQSALQLGYSEDTFKYLLDRLENVHGAIIYSKDTKEVAIKNYLRYSIIKGGAPVRDCLIKELRKVKNKDLIAQVFSHLKGYDDMNETVTNLIKEYEEKNGELQYCNEKHNDIDNENDNDNENEVSYHDTSTIRSIVDYLNQKAGTDYRYTTKKTQDKIKARLNENFTLEQFMIVIDKKCAEWMGDEKMEKYLRPETLFGTKFESYLNAKTTKRQQVNTGVPVGAEQNDLDDVF